mmetsp:Transcript_922/g.1267  ORF Transcript_922/g.1267 Transcript_922/m.1267 type:complete len:142 (-) Transcript_922:190-615(-)
MSNNEENLTIHLAITSSPTTPRTPLTIPKSSSSPTSPSKLRELASAQTNIPLDKLKLIFKGRLIVNKNDGNVVQDFGLEDGCVVHCVGKPVAVTSTATAATTTTTTTKRRRRRMKRVHRRRKKSPSNVEKLVTVPMSAVNA